MSAAGKWIVGFLAGCGLLTAVLLFAIWAYTGYGKVEMSVGGIVALSAGRDAIPAGWLKARESILRRFRSPGR